MDRMRRENPIGIYDSGVGGLTTFIKLKEILPKESYIYYGDTKNLPYGNKTKEELIEIAKGIFDFFKEKEVKAVVMACNTTSALVYESIKDKYDFRIYPLIQIASRYISKLGIKKVAILATEGTIKSHAYKDNINKNNPCIEVYEKSCPRWVPIVENKAYNDKENIEIIKNDIKEVIEYNPDKIVLGCTHYPFLIPILKEYIDKNKFIDPSKYFAKEIKEDLERKELVSKKQQGKLDFYVSKNPLLFDENAKSFIGLRVRARIDNESL